MPVGQKQAWNHNQTESRLRLKQGQGIGPSLFAGDLLQGSLRKALFFEVVRAADGLF